MHKQITCRRTVKSKSKAPKSSSGYVCLAKNFLFRDRAVRSTTQLPIIHYPCPVASSISEAHINRNHSVVLTVEEGFCIHLSGYSAPRCHQCLDVPRNRWTSKEIEPHFLQRYYSWLSANDPLDISVSTSIHKHMVICAALSITRK